MSSQPKYLSVEQAAQYCGASASKFNKLRVSGGGATFIRIGRRVVYDRDDLDAWLASNRRRSTADLGA